MMLACSAFGSYVIDKEGCLFISGMDTSRGVGNHKSFRKVPLGDIPLPLRMIDAGSDRILLIDSEGSLWESCKSETCEYKFQPMTMFPEGDYVHISCYSHNNTIIFATDSDGSLWSSEGESKKVEGLPPIRHAFCGYHFVMAEDLHGNLFSFGKNNFGQLGIGVCSWSPRNTPVPVKRPEGMAKGPLHTLSVGSSHVGIVDGEGTLWTCGSRREGQLGRVAFENDGLFHRVETNGPVEYMSCGGNNLYYVDKNNKVWGFGANKHGLFGKGFHSNTHVQLNTKPAIALSGWNHLLIQDEENRLWIMGDRNEFIEIDDTDLIKGNSYRIKDVTLGPNQTKRKIKKPLDYR